MDRRLTAVGVLILVLAGPARADEPRAAEPKGPFAGAPAGKVSFQPTEGGFLIVSNVPGNRYTYELVGKKVEQVQYENKENPDARIWAVDGIVLQSVPIPLAREGDLGYAEELLSRHQKYENDHWAQGGFAEVDSAREWASLPSGAPALSWELRQTKDADGPKKMLFASALSGRNLIVFAVTVLPKVDDAKARKLLRDTLMRLKCYEKDATRPLNSGGAQALLLNDELAGRNDRKAESAIVVGPDKLMLLVRMALELDPDPAGFIATVHDGHLGHAVTLQGYDREKKRFTYWEPWGKGSFLEEENNRAGVKAEPVPGERKMFTISEADLQTVLQGVVMVPYRGLRPYFATGNLEDAVREYRALQVRYPRSSEVDEAFLLKAGQILAEGDEGGRAVNLYAACVALHEKSARALAGIAAVYARIGQTKSAIQFYADAVKALPRDPNLDEAQRDQLAAAWESARKTLAADEGPGSKP